MPRQVCRPDDKKTSFTMLAPWTELGSIRAALCSAETHFQNLPGGLTVLAGPQLVIIIIIVIIMLLQSRVVICILSLTLDVILLHKTFSSRLVWTHHKRENIWIWGELYLLTLWKGAFCIMSTFPFDSLSQFNWHTFIQVEFWMQNSSV